MPNLIPTSHCPQALSRSEIAAILHALDPVDLRSPIVARINARSFTTEDLLARLALRLERHGVVNGGDRGVMHLGAHSAGIGLWLAESARSHAIIVDPEPAAIEIAMQACGAFELEHFPSFQVAPFHGTELPARCAHAIISMEALYLAPDPHAALAELHRLLDEDGLLMFDAYVADADGNARGWVYALESAEFDLIDIDDRTDPWREIMRARHLARIQWASYLAERLGHRRAAHELAASRSMLALLPSTRRVELIARRRNRKRTIARGSQRMAVRTPVVSPVIRP